MLFSRSRLVSLGDQRSKLWRQFKASWRDTWLLFREFSWPLFFFCLAIIGGGIVNYLLSIRAGFPLTNPLEAIYHVLALTFLQSSRDFPTTWYLQIFYFLMPLIGIIILAQGITEFGVMLFNRRGRSKEWQVAVASTFDHHIVLVGLGHLGYRVARDLAEMGRDVVVIEQNPEADLIASAKDAGIPVIQDDASRENTLIQAGIRKARAIILCIQNDSLNLKIALKARHINPNIQVVVRIFDDDFAQALQDQFKFTAFSATGMAAPAFAAAATGVDITRPITVEGTSLCLATITVSDHTRLNHRTVEQIEQQYNVSVVLHRSAGHSDLHPPAGTQMNSGDTLAVLGGPVEINSLARDNPSSGK
jgi:voltage-gated potassium channel